MRGKRRAGACQGRPARITPAHAGKTEKDIPYLIRFSDHPRACGENRRRYDSAGGERGSPPRMRGKQRETLLERTRRRITPAHAGKTRGCCRPRSRCADHPRACGENSRAESIGCGWSGSPPRMRGKRKARPRCAVPVRITPAHAGKTSQTKRAALGYSDHPRACGENKEGRAR